jgi:hypothetical protein
MSEIFDEYLIEITTVDGLEKVRIRQIKLIFYCLEDMIFSEKMKYENCRYKIQEVLSLSYCDEKIINKEYGFKKFNSYYECLLVVKIKY